ncbi:unnamed protein product [Euphydryas editha]|uniref:Secreted protein n=1 Tax=Euphydryas editha TaxID=104508 RepID=A0AAU9TP30_EUPED|nr:unnamed protein product [Euphydryas editha]
MSSIMLLLRIGACSACARPLRVATLPRPRIFRHYTGTRVLYSDFDLRLCCVYVGSAAPVPSGVLEGRRPRRLLIEEAAEREREAAAHADSIRRRRPGRRRRQYALLHPPQ